MRLTTDDIKTPNGDWLDLFRYDAPPFHSFEDYGGLTDLTAVLNWMAGRIDELENRLKEVLEKQND